MIFFLLYSDEISFWCMCVYVSVCVCVCLCVCVSLASEIVIFTYPGTAQNIKKTVFNNTSSYNYWKKSSCDCLLFLMLFYVHKSNASQSVTTEAVH